MAVRITPLNDAPRLKRSRADHVFLLTGSISIFLSFSDKALWHCKGGEGKLYAASADFVIPV
jgi:hypothetical protein